MIDHDRVRRLASIGLVSVVVLGAGCARQQPDSLETTEPPAARTTRMLRVGTKTSTVSAVAVPPGFFNSRPVRPLLGRAFQPEDVAEDAVTVVIISHELWQLRFAGAPDAIGELISLDEEPARVIGIMPTGFAEPEGVDIWLPSRDGSLD